MSHSGFQPSSSTATPASDTPLAEHSSPNLNPATSSSSDPATSQKYKRNYRACLNCRVRKVKCDLGPVDNPHDGKCARCLRERKDCVFVRSKRGGSSNVINGKRKKTRLDEGAESYSSEGGGEVDETSHHHHHHNNKETHAGADLGSSGGVSQISQSHRSASSYSLPGVNSIFSDESQRHRHSEALVGDSFHAQHRPPPNLPRTSLQEQQQQQLQQQQKNQNTPTSNFATMEGALVFLASAAGTIAKADERDHIDARAKYEQIEAISGSNSNHASADNREGYSESSGRAAQQPPPPPPPPPPLPSTRNQLSFTGNSTHGHFGSTRGISSPQHRPPLRTANSAGAGAGASGSNSSIPPYMDPTSSKRMTMPAAESGHSVRPKASTKLSNIDYIGPAPNGILTEEEAERLINLFFTTMHPFFPHIPKFLHSSKVLAGYPILLCAILTISARYHPFENNTSSNTGGTVPRHIEVHDRLWLYVQRLISQTVWAEASTRSIGTIFAFLLFTEWNPRAIHWRWSDYANRAEENESEVPVQGGPAATAGGAGVAGGAGGAGGATAATGGSVVGETSAVNTSSGQSNLAGLGAMRRSHRMAWMLIGSAVRLAQDMGFMEMSNKVLIATHIAEINCVMDISRRSMLAHSLSEIEFEEDEITEEAMELVEEDEDDDYNIMKLSEEELKKIAIEYKFKFTRAQKAQIELLQIMSLGHESFYGYKTQLGQLSQRQNLSVLNIISPLINNWNRKYKQFLIPTSSKIAKQVTSNFITQFTKPSKTTNDIRDAIKQESFIFEFNYVKLYIYSLALSPSPKKQSSSNTRTTLKLDEMSKSAKFIEQAFNAANEMLNAAHRIHKFKMLRFMPVRWLTRMVRAVAFIVKCYLTITAHKNESSQSKLGSSFIFAGKVGEIYDPTILSFSLISVDDIAQSIHRAALTLRDCSPDELHLCTRYSNVLMYLYSEMKSGKKQENDEAEVREMGKAEVYEARRDRDGSVRESHAPGDSQLRDSSRVQVKPGYDIHRHGAPLRHTTHIPQQPHQVHQPHQTHHTHHLQPHQPQPPPPPPQQPQPPHQNHHQFQINTGPAYSQSPPQSQLHHLTPSKEDSFPYGPYFKHPTSEPTSASLAGYDITTPVAVATTFMSANSSMNSNLSSNSNTHASTSVNANARAADGAYSSDAASARTHGEASNTPSSNIFGDASGGSNNASSASDLNPAETIGSSSSSSNGAGAGGGGEGGGGGIGDSEVMDWFMNNRTIGLDFVAPWTEMIEQQLNLNDQFTL
ncbi:uncharacterized protein LODBEIA_P28800 [Lodderomyces beijingensis]|uniref:Zn(2)-C6 fungal-type domain-containing protein n=1 Tax=Lodderomyces beijingensis TaxID=1775926 RepID=A0ABP0ZP35_9ASCO